MSRKRVSTGPTPRHRTAAKAACKGCGGELPCVTCARAKRRELGKVGQEPTVANVIDGYSPVVTAMLASIRKHGFVEKAEGGRTIEHTPWSERTARQRAGLSRDPIDASTIIYTPAPIPQGA